MRGQSIGGNDTFRTNGEAEYAFFGDAGGEMAGSTRGGNDSFTIQFLGAVNTPPPKGGGFKLRLKAGSVRRSADSGHIEVVIWFRRLLVFYVLDPYVVSHVSAARNPVAPAP